MNLSTKQYRVSVSGIECRKCVFYKRPKCVKTNTFVWEKNFCENYERKNSQNEEVLK